MELVLLVAGQLDNALTKAHPVRAKSAVNELVLAESKELSLSQLVTNRDFPRELIFILVVTPNGCLASHEVEVAIELELLTTAWMMPEVIELASLVFDKLEGPDLFLKGVVVGHIICPAGAAARQTSDKEEEYSVKAGYDRPLKSVNHHVDVEVASHRGDAADLEQFFPLSVLFHHIDKIDHC